MATQLFNFSYFKACNNQHNNDTNLHIGLNRIPFPQFSAFLSEYYATGTIGCIMSIISATFKHGKIDLIHTKHLFYFYRLLLDISDYILNIYTSY